MEKATQIARAEAFRSWHHTRPILVLPNAWDVASARLLESLGSRAIATSSAAIAFSLGYRDGEYLPRSLMLDTVSRMAAAVSVPLTADMEGGYAVNLEELAGTAGGVIAAGAIGLNIEDSLGAGEPGLIPVRQQAERIQVIRALSRTLGVPLVINARTDVFAWGSAHPEQAVSQAIERATAYRQAGADSIFVPFVSDGTVIEKLAQAIKPLNILASAATPPISELEQVGVARVSVGSSLFCAVMGRLERLGREILEQGRTDGLDQDAIAYGAANVLFGGK